GGGHGAALVEILAGTVGRASGDGDAEHGDENGTYAHGLFLRLRRPPTGGRVVPVPRPVSPSRPRNRSVSLSRASAAAGAHGPGGGPPVAAAAQPALDVQ